MTGPEALQAMLDGKKVRRTTWKRYRKIGTQTYEGEFCEFLDFCHIGFEDKHTVFQADLCFKGYILGELTCNNWKVVK